MNRYLLFFTLISLVLSQTSTGTLCPSPCYAPNTNPCPTTDLVCKDNPTVGTNCPKVCVKSTDTNTDVNAAFAACSTPCDTRTYQCTSDQICVQKNSTSLNSQPCFNCDPACTPQQCNTANCANDFSGKECAAKLSSGSNTAAICKDNYCTGCAQWFLNGNQVCNDVAPTCNPCPTACPSGSKVKVNPTTGCDDCGNCEPICAPPCSSGSTMQCPNGYARDSATGCPICQCNPCPDISQCAQTVQCPNGYAVDPNTGCKKCDCAKPTCPDTSTCTPCNNGFAIDPTTGCTTCKCNDCVKQNCTNTPCHNGVYLDKTTGCPTCDCLPSCSNFCPNGYDFSSSVDGTTQCKCLCQADFYCNSDCGTAGNKIDAYGCKLCECNPTYNNCPKVACDLYCELGYVLDDSTKCPTCKCIEKPTVCPAYACAVNCLYGSLKDAYGCPNCDCNPCPTEVLCSRACLYGFAKSTNGCPSCTCNDAPVCPTTANVDPASCPLDCVKGLQTDSGCTYCKCAAVEPCKCDPIPTNYKAVLCADGVTYQKYTDVCIRDEKGICSLVMTKCPIGIQVTVTKELTQDEIEAIKSSLGITNDDDFTVTKDASTTGKVTYTIWVQKDGIPATSSANDVKTTTENKARESDPNAVALVISDGSTMAPSFGHILVPFFGLLSAVFLFF